MATDNPFPDTVMGAGPGFVTKERFRRNLWIMILFALPVMYVGIILAVFIHEVIGHGLTALLLGGEFNGFGIALDGLGWARVEISHLPVLNQAIVLFSGAFYTTVFALLFYGLSRALRNRPFAALTCLFWAIISVLDGLPYFFWDAIALGGIGDFSVISMLYPHRGLRALAIILCGPLMAGSLVLFNISYYKIAYNWLGEGKTIKLKGKIILSMTIFLLQVLGWFSFDWDQLIPGIGIVPEIFGTGIALITLVWLIAFFKVKDTQGSRQGPSRSMLPLSVAWTACAGVIIVIVQWLQHGVSFF